MKTKILLIMGIIFLFLSLPVIMGNGETESEHQDKKEQLQKEIERYNGLSNLASEQIANNKAKLADIEASKKALGEKIVLIDDGEDGYKTLKEIENRLNDATYQLTESQKLYDELYNNYTQVEENKGPNYFESEESLQEWIELWNTIAQPSEPKNTTEKINWARKLQAAGLSDGFIININFFHNVATGQYEVTCTANVKGTVHSWEAGSSDVKPDESGVRVLRNFMSIKELENWMKDHIEPMDLENATLEELEEIGGQIVEAAAEDGYIIRLTTDCYDTHGIVKYKAYCQVYAGDHYCTWLVGKNDLTIIY